MTSTPPLAMGHIYGSGPFRNTNPGISAANTQTNCLQCPDHRIPSLNTVIYGDTRKGYLPAGSYGFTQEGAVINATTGLPLGKNDLLARTQGPIYGATMGSCVPRASQSRLLDRTGWFSPVPSPLSRGCYI